MYLITSNLYSRCLTLSFLTHKPRYSVFVRLNNVFSEFNFNTNSANLCRTFYIYFTWSMRLYLVLTVIPYMYARTISNILESLDIFYWKMLEKLQTPMDCFWYSDLPHGSKIVQNWLAPGDS